MSVFATVGFSVFYDRGYIFMYICPVNVSRAKTTPLSFSVTGAGQ